MKILRQNNIMRTRFPISVGDEGGELPCELNRIIERGLVIQGQCVFLDSLFRRCSSASMKDFFDETGYECFVNEIHVEDYVSTNFVTTGMRFLTRVSRLCVVSKVPFTVRGIISADDDCAIVRFHRDRPCQNWLDKDLENYKSEGVAEIEVYQPTGVSDENANL